MILFENPPSIEEILETSTMWSAAFATGFLEVNLIFKTCQNAFFWAHLWDMINLELHRKHLSLQHSATLIIFVLAILSSMISR